MDANNKKLGWNNLALMAFVSVWGFGNVVNGLLGCSRKDRKKQQND